MKTTIRLIGSGTRDNGVMSGFKRVIPWENLPEYRGFLQKLIQNKIVITTLETFQSSFFNQLLLESKSKVVIVTKERIEKAKNVLQICPSFRNAAAYARRSRFEEVTILTGSSICEEALHGVSEVFYMRVDTIVGDGTDHFPRLDKLDFHMASAMPLRVEKPEAQCIGNRCLPGSVIPIEFQHWFKIRKEKQT